MQIAEIKMAQIQFGEGGNVMRVDSTPECGRSEMTLEYLLVTAPEEEKYDWMMILMISISNDRILETVK